jgi:anti-sigma B factor antagonist
MMAAENTIEELTDERIESLELKFQKVISVPGCVVVSMKGYIDTYNASHFQRQVDKAIQTGYCRLIFDFSGITYVSSTGIGAFTHFLKEVRPRGGDLVLVGMITRVIEVFQLLGFASFFNIEKTLEGAVEMLKTQSKQDIEGPFPQIFGCPICAKKLRASKAGRFRCSECKSILIINESAQVSLG